jgi:hypothetical protein
MMETIEAMETQNGIAEGPASMERREGEPAKDVLLGCARNLGDRTRRV